MSQMLHFFPLPRELHVKIETILIIIHSQSRLLNMEQYGKVSPRKTFQRSVKATQKAFSVLSLCSDAWSLSGC